MNTDREQLDKDNTASIAEWGHSLIADLTAQQQIALAATQPPPKPLPVDARP